MTIWLTGHSAMSIALGEVFSGVYSVSQIGV